MSKIRLALEMEDKKNEIWRCLDPKVKLLMRHMGSTANLSPGKQCRDSPHSNNHVLRKKKNSRLVPS